LEFFESSSRQSTIDLRIGDCRRITEEMASNGVLFDAIICDPPYEIGYMAKDWDATGIAFQTETWLSLAKVLKPGGYLVAFGGARVYHHLALAIEQAGFETHPFLTWHYPAGLPKPMNVAKLMDKDNHPDREPTSFKKGSGYNTAHLRHGRQNYSKLEFPVYEGLLSEEAQRWDGYYYGMNTLKPAFDPIYLGRKPIDQPRMIDNIRKHGTGALNIKRLHSLRGGEYPSNSFYCAKTHINQHGSSHPTVKPTRLMRELIALCCPADGHVLDPFAGTGSTALAACELGHDCTLIEIDAGMKDEIARRCGIKFK
jgi:site-specific DNA-methyltransferase (adenine-specific)